METIFLPYRLALMAKEHKFNEICYAYYPHKVDGLCLAENKAIPDDNIYIEIHKLPQKGLPAPAYKQITEWFRDNHNIKIVELVSADGYAVWEKANEKKWLSFTNKPTLDEAIEIAFKLIII